VDGVPKRPGGDEEALTRAAGRRTTPEDQTTRDHATAPTVDVVHRPDQPPPKELERGSTLGRYVVLEVLGAGGMGLGRDRREARTPGRSRGQSPLQPRLARDDEELPARVGVFQRSLALQEKMGSTTSPFYADTLHILGNRLRHEGRLSDAIAATQRALALREQLFGPSHPLVALSCISLSVQRAQNGEFVRALELQERIGTIYSDIGEADGADAALNLTNMGEILMSLGRLDEADAKVHLGLDQLVRKLGPNNPYIAGELLMEGAIELALARDAKHSRPPASEGACPARWVQRRRRPGALGDRERYRRDGPATQALEPLESALVVQQAEAQASDELGGTRFALARALWATGGNRTRARDLAVLARGNFEATHHAKELGDVDAWLAARPDMASANAAVNAP
jgi:tetratricopeptide (TPR) repeat protein